MIIPPRQRRAYWTAIGLASLACGSSAFAQTNSGPATVPTPVSGSSTNVTKIKEVTVFGQLDEARNKIAADLGATTYTIDKTQIETQPQGVNSAFNQVLLRAPGVVQDSFGQVHVRGEHANLQYRINDVILPEGITGFGSELDTRFVNSMELITGALPAQYGFRQAGVVDIHTKSGAFDPGGQVSVYGGSYDTLRPGFEYGGHDGNLNYFVDGSYLHTGMGIENPTGSKSPIHDNSDQYKGFAYLSYVLDDTSRLSLILSASHSFFQIPNSPGQTGGTDPNGAPWPMGGYVANSSGLDENQTEQNYYGVVAYQKALGDLNFQLAAFERYSGVLFRPDYQGDLYFNGVSSRVDRNVVATGLQGDASYDLNAQHTLRGGFQMTAQRAVTDTTTGVFAIDGFGNGVAPAYNVVDNGSKWGYLYGIYAQDEWKLTDKLTLNFGSRFDVSDAYLKETEFGPRFNTIFKATDSTTLHAGYARFFTPPPLESIQQTTLAKFAGTSNAPLNPQNDPVKSERAHYFDAGVTQMVLPGLQVGLDAYYKMSRNTLDEGQFGQSLIQTPFNYQKGIIYGTELSATYKKDGFSIFANGSYSVSKAENIDSAQFNFSPADLAYIQNHYIFTDHNQTFTGSFGVSYRWEHTLVYTDILYGNGLRAGGDVPNGRKLPAYSPVNLGVQHEFKLEKTAITARFDVVNVFDQVYELRDGSGIGVGAPQFGARRGFYGSLSYAF